MATKRWRGDAPAVAQVATIEVSAYDADTTYSLLINGKTIASIAAAGSAAATATALASQWNASTVPEAAEVTAEAASDTITFTADEAGVPFEVEEDADGGTGTIGAMSVSVAATGPNHWDEPLNWSDGAVPDTGDEVDLIASDVDILYGLDQSTVTLARLTRHEDFTGAVGLADYNEQAGLGTRYYEYRTKELTISATKLEIHPSSAGRFRINVGENQTTAVIFGTGDVVAAGSVAPVELRGTHADNVVEVLGGTVAIAMGTGQAATVTLKIATPDGEASEAEVLVGAGVTLTAVTKSGGTLRTYGAVTAGTQFSGEWHHYDGAFASPVFAGGVVYYRSDDQLTAPVLSGDAALDFSRDPSPRTVTDAQVHGTATINDPLGTVTWTNGIDLVRRGLDGINLGKHLNIAKAAV